MSYTVTAHMIECLDAEEYDSFDSGVYGSEENAEIEKENAEAAGREYQGPYEDEYEYDRDALKKALIKWQAEHDKDGFAMLWIAPDGSWFTSTIEAYFHLSDNKDYEQLLFNAFKAGAEAATWGCGCHEDDFKSWRKYTRTA